MFFQGDANHKILLRVLLWIFLLAAFLSIPINFERPRRQFFDRYISKRPLYTLIVLIQVIALGAGIFIFTVFAVLWCIPSLKEYALVLGAANSIMYSCSLLLEFSLLPKRLGS
jgi:hypothetical protein